MNEQIKGIQTLAGLQAYYDTQQSDIEKFAELIIKECTARLRTVDWAYDLGEDSGPNDIALMAAEDIEQYFGVK